MAMSLGAYTLAINPEKCTIPKKNKRSSVVETFGGGNYFSWGTFLEGQILTLTWPFMSTSQFNSLQTLLEADAQVVWDPENGHTYNVEISSLFGDYHLSAQAGAEYKKNVTMQLVIISLVT